MHNIFTDMFISHCGMFPYTKDEENSNFCSTFGWLESLQRRRGMEQKKCLN